jgi:hypothetical protein
MFFSTTFSHFGDLGRDVARHSDVNQQYFIRLIAKFACLKIGSGALVELITMSARSSNF